MNHLSRRGGMWWARLVVPNRLRDAAGRREFTQSCRTHELAVAKLASAILISCWRRQILALESGRMNFNILKLLDTSLTLAAGGHIPISIAAESIGAGGQYWIRADIDQFTLGNRKGLCEEIGSQIYALNGWVNKDERPSLSVLLRLCHGFGLMPAYIFLSDAIEHVTRTGVVFSAPSPRQCRPLLGYRQRERIEKQLGVVLADAIDHRGLSAVAEQVWLSRHALKYWFLGQCRDVVRKNRAVEHRRLELRYREDHAFLVATVQKMLVAGIYPSRRRVNLELSARQISLICPDIFKAFERLMATPH